MCTTSTAKRQVKLLFDQGPAALHILGRDPCAGQVPCSQELHPVQELLGCACAPCVRSSIVQPANQQGERRREHASGGSQQCGVNGFLMRDRLGHGASRIEGILASRRVTWHQARFRTAGFGAHFRIAQWLRAYGASASAEISFNVTVLRAPSSSWTCSPRPS